MKLRLDIPNSFAFERYHIHDEVQRAYFQIISCAYQLELEIVINKAIVNDYEVLKVESDSEIRYGYHSYNIGDKVYCLKPSAINNLWYFDREGYSGWSEIANDSNLQEVSKNYDLEKSVNIIESYREKFLKHRDSKVPQKDFDLSYLTPYAKDFIFYPLQVVGDRVLTLLEYTQFDVLEEIERLTNIYKKLVVIKKHPLCNSETLTKMLEILNKSEYIYVTEGNIHEILPLCQSVLVANSGVGLEALIHGKPVYTLAKSEYQHITYKLNNLSDIELLFTKNVPNIQTKECIKQIGYLLNEYFVDIRDKDSILNRMKEHITEFSNKSKYDYFDNLTKKKSEKKKKVLINRANKQIEDIVSILLKAKYFDTSYNRQERINILFTAVLMNIKTKDILNEADDEVLLSLCNSLVKNKKLDLAEDFANKLILSDKYIDKGYYYLALIKYRKSEFKSGISYINKALDYNSASSDILLLSSQFLIRKEFRNLNKAEEHANKALYYEPNNFLILVVLGRIAWYKGEKARSREFLDKAKSFNNSHVSIKNLEKTISEDI